MAPHSTAGSPPPPPGTHYLPDWYIARPSEQKSALGYLHHGHPVLLWGPRDQGRTWLCRHIARTWQAEDADRRAVTVDFRTFPASALDSLDTCLHAIADAIHAGVSGAATPPPWPRRGSAKLTRFLAETALPAVPGPLLLVFDHAELAHARPFYAELDGLLRSLAEKTSAGLAPWNRLRLLVSVSVPPARIHTGRFRSPFINLSDPIQVHDFTGEQIAAQAARFGLAWGDSEIATVMAAIGGQPYLVTAVLWDVVAGSYAVDVLGSDQPLPPSRLADHLARPRQRLEASPELAAAFARLLANPADTVEPELLDNLVELGLVSQGPNNSHPVRYPLYKRLAAAAGTAAPRRAARLFYSYCHKDEAMRDRLDVHLRVLVRQGLLEAWHDRRIVVGTEWKGEIDRHLEAADIILLLVSADFLASNYCWDIETRRAMERHDAGEAKVVPVILSPCDWMKATPFAKVQGCPRDALPVTLWANGEQAWADVAQAVRLLVESLP